MTDRIPLFAPHHPPELAQALDAAFARVAASGRYVLGPEVERFERAFARELGVEHVVGVSSGTDALLCTLLALGVGPRDEVVTTPLSFVATAEAIARTGATPVFADVRADTLCLDAAATEEALSPRTRAIVAVHLYGAPAPLGALAALAERRGVALVEDAAQAAGGALDGRRLGAWGTAAAFSFFPSKPLGGLGDGGAIATRDPALAAKCRSLRVHGRAAGEACFERLGGNFRLDALQAALLTEKLAWLGRWRAERAEIARDYDDGLADLVRCGRVERVGPASAGAVEHAHAVYALRVHAVDRDELRRGLAGQGVETAVYYPRLLCAEPCLEGRCRVAAAGLAQATAATRELLSLPIYPGLSPPVRQRVISELVRLLG